MKKFVCLLLAMTIMMGMAAINASADEKVTLTFSSWGDAAEKAALEKILAAFSEKTGIAVDYQYIPEDYLTKLTTMAAAGELPDCGYMTEAACVQWANEGMLEDLSPLAEQDGYAEKLPTNQFVDKNGKVIGVSMANETIILYYNRAYFDQMGIAYPPSKVEDAWTWDQFVDVCKKLTVDANGKHPGEDGFDPANIVTYGCKIPKYTYAMEPLLRSNGGGIFTADGSDIALDSPESLEVFQKLSDLINVEHVHPAPDAAVMKMDMSSSFLSNNVAMVIDGQWNIQSMAIATQEDGINWDVGVLPKFKNAITGNTGAPTVVFKGTKHKDEAMQLASYVLSTDYVMNLIKSGLWQPTTKDWYTNEDLISRWITPGVHPDSYRDAVINYTISSAMQANSFFKIGCCSQIDDVYVPALDPVWIGTSTASDAIKSVVDQCRKIYSDYKASIA